MGKTSRHIKSYDFIKEPKGYCVESPPPPHGRYASYRPYKYPDEIKILGIFTKEEIAPDRHIKFFKSSEKIQIPGADVWWCIRIRYMWILYDGSRWFEFFMMSYGSETSYGFEQDEIPKYMLTTNDKDIMDELIADYIERTK